MPADQWESELMEYKEALERSGYQLSESETKWLGSWEDAAKWDPMTRWEKIAGEMEFEIRIFSTLGDRQRMIEQMTFFLQTVAQVPEAMQKLDLDEFMRYAARAFDFSPGRVLKLGTPPQQPQGPPQGHLKGEMYQGMANTQPSPPMVTGKTNPGTQQLQ